MKISKPNNSWERKYKTAGGHYTESIKIITLGTEDKAERREYQTVVYRVKSKQTNKQKETTTVLYPPNSIPNSWHGSTQGECVGNSWGLLQMQPEKLSNMLPTASVSLAVLHGQVGGCATFTLGPWASRALSITTAVFCTAPSGSQP